MAAANISSEKIDLLIYGPIRPILENGFPDQFVLHMAESRADLERLTPDVVAKIRGMAVTYHMVPADELSRRISPSSKSSRASRRLRPCRFRLCARAQYRRHQHA